MRLDHRNIPPLKKGVKNMRLKILALIIGASFLLNPFAWANDSDPIVAKIELLGVNENDQISVSLIFTLKNNSAEPVKVLKWGTPFEGEFTRDTFTIIHNGERAPYIGKLVKRLPPQKEDFIEIPANSELSEIVYLEDGYKIYAPGFYTVQYAHETLRVKAAPQKMKMSAVQSSEVGFNVLFGTTEDAATSHSVPKSKCSSSQFSAIQSGHRAAKNIASAAKQALHNTPASQRPQARRYVEWFGTYNSSRYSRVTSNFDKVHDALFNKNITADCPGNRPNVYAYVYPSQPYKIYFCGAFFRAPLTGTDSKAGTIIHELTHFYVVAGTDDVVYGQSGARNLAQSNPDAAIRNADSHEYFAENTPQLPMSGGSGGSGGGAGGGGGCFVQSVMD